MKKRKIIDTIKIAIFPALIISTLWIQIPLPNGVAPITLQSLFVLIAGLYLGVKNGTLSMEIYVIMGAIGIPVFASYQGGFGVLMGPNGGYLVAFIIAAFIVGALKDISYDLTLTKTVFIVFIGMISIYLIGIPWMMFSLEIDLKSALLINIAYVPGDIIKTFVAAIIGYKLIEHDL